MFSYILPVAVVDCELTVIASVATWASAVEACAILVADPAVLAQIRQTQVDGVLAVGPGGAWYAAVAVDASKVGRTGALNQIKSNQSSFTIFY